MSDKTPPSWRIHAENGLTLTTACTFLYLVNKACEFVSSSAFDQNGLRAKLAGIDTEDEFFLEPANKAVTDVPGGDLITYAGSSMIHILNII